jgi:hypothetical protein
VNILLLLLFFVPFAYLSVTTDSMWMEFLKLLQRLHVVRLRRAIRLGLIHNLHVWTMAFSGSKGLEKENPPSLSSLFFSSLFVFTYVFFLFFSFIFSVFILARQSYIIFFNQDGLWCKWDMWRGSCHPPPHLDFCVKVKCAESGSPFLSVFHYQRAPSYIIDEAPHTLTHPMYLCSS